MNTDVRCARCQLWTASDRMSGPLCDCCAAEELYVPHDGSEPCSDPADDAQTPVLPTPCGPSPLYSVYQRFIELETILDFHVKYRGVILRGTIDVRGSD